MTDNIIPSGINLNRLKKVEILWLYNHLCQHKHRYTEHPQCFLDEHGDHLAITEKIAFIDIETTGLQAEFGYILCYSIKPLDGEITHRTITPQEIRTYKFDKKVIQQFIQDIKGYDRLVGYYSKDNRFDIPFLRTRALRHGITFPEWRDYLFTDVYDLVRPKLRLRRNRLEVACELLGIPSKQHRLNPEVWQRAQAGGKKALDYIQLHCDEDVISLELVYKKLKGFGSPNRASI